MEKRLVIEIGIDGKVKAETVGIKGKACLEYIELLEKLLDAETIDSNYLSEYYETNIKTDEKLIQKVREI
ncbi:DUF2997 domain-containing protein [Cytobacillus sp. FJAT-54145]|uniref:DUF2997 domain-containing protein n=1 Tax=Cytobacillus spartinae TaxID=3299023 RepID=A0ABW6KBI8_9BACI